MYIHMYPMEVYTIEGDIDLHVHMYIDRNSLWLPIIYWLILTFTYAHYPCISWCVRVIVNFRSHKRYLI